MLRGFWLERRYVRVPAELRWTDGRIASGANWNGTISAVIARAVDVGGSSGDKRRWTDCLR